MNKGTRLLLATVTGVAVLSGGLAATSTTASAKAIVACDLNATDVSSVTLSDAFVPLKDDNKVEVTIGLKEMYGKPASGTDVYAVEDTTPNETDATKKKWVVKRSIQSVKAEVFRTGETAARAVELAALPGDFPYSGAAAVVENKVAVGGVPATSDLKGSFLVKETDKDKAGKWTIKVTVTRAAATESCKEFDVSAKAGISGAYVSPNPVQLIKGQDVKVSVRTSVKDASSVTARLVSEESSESYELGELIKGTDEVSYRGSTYFSDDTQTGDWALEVTATRGGQALKGVGATFTVRAPTGGVAKKAKSKVTIAAPNKAKVGKAFKVYGKVYRGSKAYSGKIVELYFKKKGGSYKFMGFAKATSTGKYAKKVKQKVDGYWRIKVPGTSKTKGSYSAHEYVDVK